jgi:hypothetical protein
MFIDKKILTIVALILSAAVMLWLNFSPAARADVVIKDQNYQMITTLAGAGGQGLYIMDGNTGLMAVFTYDANTHTLKPRAFISITNLFPPR